MPTSALPVVDFNRLAAFLRQAPFANNPRSPRLPPELRAVYDEIGSWFSRPLTANDKLDKPPRGRPWLVRGIAFIPARNIRSFFRTKAGRWDQERLEDFGVTKEQVLAVPDVCPGATEGCAAVCLSDAGRQGQSASVRAQVNRLLSFTHKRKAYLTVVAIAIAKLHAEAAEKGARTGVRLNILSDVSWERIPIEVDPYLAKYLNLVLPKRTRRIKAGTYPNFMAMFPKIQFYDYTKIGGRMQAFLDGRFPPNYFLTWSLAETRANRRKAMQVLRHPKGVVAVAFAVPSERKGGPTRPLPKVLAITDRQRGTLITRLVVDADKHDVRPLDLRTAGGPCFAGLRFKIPLHKLKGMSTEQKMEAAGAFVVDPDKKSIEVMDGKRK
jgi:hypothetical protein